ncbi:MAG: CYTH domain-containing protein [Draconibacterium sp.]|nr:CYTH domain-containing protein [Draconibacterium sp.]
MKEIERKFLVNKEKWIPKTQGTKIVQGYLSVDKERIVRVRIKGDKAFLTLKGKPKGISCTELEYGIPVNEAQVLFDMCLDNPIEKIRYVEKIGELSWEIDFFEGVNSGLVLAEVELETENQLVQLPDWAETEVSYDFRYFNAWLSQHPFTSWED